MDKEAYLNALHDAAAALAAAARLGLRVPVPSCPGWVVADLVVHTGGVHRAQAEIVRTRAQEPLSITREMFTSVSGLLEWLERSTLMGGQTDLDAIPEGLVAWFEDGAQRLESVLWEADPDETVWNWSGDHRVAHYLRMLPIETAVHRWDAQLAQGRPEPIARELAREGIGQTFEVMAPFRRRLAEAPPGQGEVYQFRQTDGDGAWRLRFYGDAVDVENGHGDADVSVAASASDLFLFLWHRIPATDLHVGGDGALLARYFELVPPL